MIEDDNTKSLSPAEKAWRQAFLGIAFLVVTGFVAFHVGLAASERSPENRLRALAPRVGAVVLDESFDPAQHDRGLTRGESGEGPLHIADFGDRVIFLNFWATWCEPCIRELPSMLALARRMPSDRFTMIAVSYDENWEDVERFFKRHLGRIPPELHVVRDPGPPSDLLKARYGTEKLPETYILKGGRIRHRFINTHDWTDRGKLEYFNLLLMGD